MDTVVILSIVFPENISKFFSMYGYGFHIGRVFPKRIFKVISMYEHTFYIGHMFPKRLSGFLECMGMIGVLAMYFQKKKIVMVFRMYEHDCHIGHVFPEKVEALWAWLAYSPVFPEKIPYVLSLCGHVKHCHIDHGFQKKIKSYCQVSCKDIIVTLVMLFPDFFPSC